MYGFSFGIYIIHLFSYPVSNEQRKKKSRILFLETNEIALFAIYIL